MTPSMLNSAGPFAARIESLWWGLFALLIAVFIVVCCFLFTAIFRRRENPHNLTPDVRPDPAGESSTTRVVLGAVGLTVLILFAVLVLSVTTGRSVYSANASEPLVIKVTGNQWWWKFEYQDKSPSQTLITANELHIPTGEPILLKLNSTDVIHSFWVPSLQGKRDLIPGKDTDLWIQADQPGVYPGQCAEFCGYQHAKMAVTVIAEPRDRFLAWMNEQRQPAHEPVDEVAMKGRDVFLSHSCVMCHTIRGTTAGGSVAPELTHIGSRLGIAAETLPNTRGHLAGWVVDPQTIKPGVKMPPNQLEPDDLQTLLAYLESLK
jgi:cytochrome c oxidase subunit II